MVDERRIEEQEQKDAFIVSRIMEQRLGRNPGISNIKSERTGKFCNYDLVTTFNANNRQYSIAIEIKERNKDKYDAMANPCSELKEIKRDRIMAITGSYDSVYYVSLVNDTTAYGWNLRMVDWDTTESFIWTIKRTQYSDSNEMEVAKTYKLPWDNADFTCDITGIVDDYLHK